MYFLHWSSCFSDDSSMCQFDKLTSIVTKVQICSWYLMSGPLVSVSPVGLISFCLGCCSSAIHHEVRGTMPLALFFLLKIALAVWSLICICIWTPQRCYLEGNNIAFIISLPANALCIHRQLLKFPCWFWVLFSYLTFLFEFQIYCKIIIHKDSTNLHSGNKYLPVFLQAEDDCS